MKVAVAYTFPMVNSATYYRLAYRFASTWREHPPGRVSHELHIICNGGYPQDTDKRAFNGIPCVFHGRSNTGWDIGGFQYAADIIPCDLLVCFGAPVHFYKPGWLDRMVDVYVEEGPHLYGCWGYLYPNWHIRTTVFWLHPDLLNSYPFVIGTSRVMRYDFEHGNNSITRHVLKNDLRAVVCSWNQTWDHPWSGARFGIGDCLCLDQHTHL